MDTKMAQAQASSFPSCAARAACAAPVCCLCGLCCLLAAAMADAVQLSHSARRKMRYVKSGMNSKQSDTQSRMEELSARLERIETLLMLSEPKHFSKLDALIADAMSGQKSPCPEVAEAAPSQLDAELSPAAL